MSHLYYYLAASLPLLQFEGKPSISVQEFLEDCERLLDDQDFKDVRFALSNEHIGDIKAPVVKEWVEFNRRFRNEIAWFRAIELNKDPQNFMRGDRYVEPYLVDAVVEASKATNPLEGEKILDRVRWEKLEELEQSEYFNLDFIIVYGLKLQILERYQVIDSSKGSEIFDQYKQMELPAFETV